MVMHAKRAAEHAHSEVHGSDEQSDPGRITGIREGESPSGVTAGRFQETPPVIEAADDAIHDDKIGVSIAGFGREVAVSDDHALGDAAFCGKPSRMVDVSGRGIDDRSLAHAIPDQLDGEAAGASAHLE
jgi:hypothetical protein